MSIPTLMVSLYICIFVLGALLFMKAFPDRKRVEIRWLLLFTATVCLISFCALNVYTQEALHQKAFFSRLRFLGYSIIGQTWFFFLLSTYGRRGFLHKPVVVALSFAPALVTWALVLVPGWNHFLTQEYELFPWEGALLVTWKAGPWFSFHIGLTYLVVLIGVAFSLLEIRRVEPWKKKQIVLLALGGIGSVMLDFYLVATNDPFRWAMLSGSMYAVGEGLILYTIVKHGLLDLSLIAKDRVFHEIPDPILVVDDNKRLLDFNGSAGSIFRLTSENLYRSIETIDTLRTLSLESRSQECRLVEEGAAPRYFQVVKEPLKMHGISNGRILSFHEITAQKAVEENLNNNLEFKARLLSMIAHDFSGVLQAQSQLSSTLEKEVGPELKKQASALADSTFTSQDFMTNVLLWARTQENKFQPVVRPYELNVLLKEVVNSLEGIWRFRDLRVEILSARDPLVLNGDGVMIESVIRNLLTNAIRASSAGQRIELSVRERPGEIEILIRDEGVGISPKYLEAIRGNSPAGFGNTEARPQGFGLGLAIAHRFVALHGGHLEFVSKEGEGTLVILRLPAQEPGR